MKSPALLILAIVGFLVASAGWVYLLVVYASGLTLLDLLSGSPAVIKFFLVTGLVLMVTGLFSGLSGVRSLALSVASLAVGVAVLGALYGELNVRIAMQAVGGVPFAITAPSRAEILFVLSIGFLGAVAALGGLSLRKRAA